MHFFHHSHLIVGVCKKSDNQGKQVDWHLQRIILSGTNSSKKYRVSSTAWELLAEHGYMGNLRSCLYFKLPPTHHLTHLLHELGPDTWLRIASKLVHHIEHLVHFPNLHLKCSMRML